MTNYDKCFGTPERAALSTIDPYADALTGAQMIRGTSACGSRRRQTMTSAMPRDRLGRIVYAGDVVEGLGTVNAADGGYLLFKAFLGHLPVASDRATVNLSASPERTNYERYFADIATRDDIEDARVGVCDSVLDDACSNCVFYDWEKFFDIHIVVDCDGFDAWLDERAVI